MKQNSRILFHNMCKTLIKSYLHRLRSIVLSGAIIVFGVSGSKAADKPEPMPSFDPSKGFKSAQTDLTEVFLQIAGSLEFYGSPEPYLRHMKAEHARIEAKYQKQLGETPVSFCPAYMDGAYLDRLAANWKHMVPQLGLDPLAKNTGRLMRVAINGTDGKGTAMVEAFNQHQHEVYAAITSKRAVPIPDFDVLKARIMKSSRLDGTQISPVNLTADQQAVAIPVNDARAGFLKLFSALDAGLPTADAAKVKTAIVSIVTDVGRMAHSELEVALLEESLDGLRASRPAYSADQETALSAEEKLRFATFLNKSRFTRTDLPELDKFYSTVYDKLTERGKLEMHNRLQAGMRPAK